MIMVPGHSTSTSRTDSGGACNSGSTVIWGWLENKVNYISANQHIVVVGHGTEAGADEVGARQELHQQAGSAPYVGVRERLIVAGGHFQVEAGGHQVLT